MKRFRVTMEVARGYIQHAIAERLQRFAIVVSFKQPSKPFPEFPDFTQGTSFTSDSSADGLGEVVPPHVCIASTKTLRTTVSDDQCVLAYSSFVTFSAALSVDAVLPAALA